MTLKSHVSQCKDVPAGQGVSYGLGLIPLGYADGIPRSAAGGPVRVNGVTYPVVGRIAMDQMVIDLGRAGLVASGAPQPGRRLPGRQRPEGLRQAEQASGSAERPSLLLHLPAGRAGAALHGRF